MGKEAHLAEILLLIKFTDQSFTFSVNQIDSSSLNIKYLIAVFSFNKHIFINVVSVLSEEKSKIAYEFDWKLAEYINLLQYLSI